MQEYIEATISTTTAGSEIISDLLMRLARRAPRFWTGLICLTPISPPPTGS